MGAKEGLRVCICSFPGVFFPHCGSCRILSNVFGGENMTENPAAEEIIRLKKESGAFIFAHNYTLPEVQEIADFTGDSLELSIKAKEVKAEKIVFCGVSFMAETAKILSPASKVLHPVPSAGCAMADMVTAEKVAQYRKSHPGTVIVAYVNTTATVKAEVDICCTSANAERIVRSIPAEKSILFLPDCNLGRNVMNALGRKMELWPGYCPVHHHVTPEMIREARALHPGGIVLVHPECPEGVVREADHALSTGAMLRYLRTSEEKEFIVGTEKGILHRMKKENPEKIFHPLLPELVCPDMKKITLEDVLKSLKEDLYEVVLPEETMFRARKAIENMLAIK